MKKSIKSINLHGGSKSAIDPYLIKTKSDEEALRILARAEQITTDGIAELNVEVTYVDNDFNRVCFQAKFGNVQLEGSTTDSQFEAEFTNVEPPEAQNSPIGITLMQMVDSIVKGFDVQLKIDNECPNLIINYASQSRMYTLE